MANPVIAIAPDSGSPDAMKKYILGGGVTGLAAAFASGLPLFEATARPGGICSSYYIRPHTQQRLTQPPEDGEVYRFERGGGHWIFGNDPFILRFIQNLTPLKQYSRRSSVYLQAQNRYIPYPLQNHLRTLEPTIASQALIEITSPPKPYTTMKEWLQATFGATLCDLFFDPFHERYTAGLYEKIAPQDPYKSPIHLPSVIHGALQDSPPVGYNVNFVYPEKGLNTLTQRMAEHCDIHYNRRVDSIDIQKKQIHFEEYPVKSYDYLLSTLPLNKMLQLTQLTLDEPPDPYTSVLVLNIGAERGKLCPDDHWLYNIKTQSGFHRVGFYSNIDSHFLPKSAQTRNNKVSLYVERAFIGGESLSETDKAEYINAVIHELQNWQFIAQVEVLDDTWIETAYTWSLPHSQWRDKALQLLERHNIYQMGRYGRWKFQGISDSIKEGFVAGMSFKIVSI